MRTPTEVRGIFKQIQQPLFEFVPFNEDNPNPLISPLKPNPKSISSFPSSIFKPTNPFRDSEESDNQDSDEEPSSTDANEVNDENHLNRRLNMDDNDDNSLFDCNNSVISRTGKLQKIESSQRLRPTRLNFQPQHSQLRRTNFKQQEINPILLRRLPYKPHRKTYNN